MTDTTDNVCKTIKVKNGIMLNLFIDLIIIFAVVGNWQHLV